MPLDQVPLHLSKNRFRTCLLDRAAHCHNEACIPDQLGRKGLWMIGEDVYSTFSHYINDGRVDPCRWYCARALRVHPVFLGKGLGHLTSSRVLNTNKQHRTLGQLWPLEELVDKSGN